VKKTSKFRFRSNPGLLQLVHEMSTLSLDYDLADIADASFSFDGFDLPTVADAQTIVDLYRKADGHAIYVVLHQEDSAQTAYFFIAPLKETKAAMTALINEERRECAQAPTRTCIMNTKKIVTCSIGRTPEASCLRPSRAPKSTKSQMR